MAQTTPAWHAMHGTAAGVASVALGAAALGVWAGPVAALALVVAALAAALVVSRSQLTVARTTAESDPLTGVGNRRRLDRALAALPVGGVVVVLDLDHFKRFNDRYGHLAGDGVLRDFGRVLATSVRGSDAVCRFGGEEFVVVVPDPADAGDLFLRIRTAWEAISPAVTFSAGLAALRPGERPQDTMQRADASLYEAKVGGRDRQSGTVGSPAGACSEPARA